MQSVGRCSYGHQRRQRGESLRSDAGDLAELPDPAEAAVLPAVVEDAPGDARPDAVERVELLQGRGVEVDGSGRRRGRGAPTRARGLGCGGRYRAALRDEHLPPVLELRGEVDGGQVGVSSGAAGAFERVID